MRSLAIAALLLVSLCAVPLASAEPQPPNPCVEKQVVGPVSTNRNCGLTVSIPLMSCPLGGSWKDTHVGNNVVRVYTCDRPV